MASIEADTEAVISLLRHLVKPEVVDVWLNKKNSMLGQSTPLEMIRQGETEKVLEALARVEEGIYV